MSTTPNLDLPYILAAQSQKHVTHNHALRALDCLVQLSVADRDLASPPGSPVEGARYIVAASAAGAWQGHEGEIAAHQDGAWAFYAPGEGWLAWVADENVAVVHDGSSWISLGGGGGSVNPTPLVGVNATADTTNRLSVSAPATLFNHEGAGHQLKLNKAGASDTASLLFQAAFSGRAEIGLTGDDDLHVKVSPDGSTWHEAIVVDRATGEVTFPATSLSASGGGTNPNLLVNGDFQINQRVFAGGALSAGAYGFDRWKAATGGADVSVSGYVVTLASGEIEQPIEPALWRVTNFASTQFTVSVDTPSEDMTVTLGSASGTITAGSGRRSVTLTTGAGDTGNLSLKLKRAAAGSVTFGRVKVELGASATAWQARSAAADLALALRYFWRYSPSNGRMVNGLALSTTDARFIFSGFVFRAAPSVSFNLCDVIATTTPRAVSAMSVIAYDVPTGILHLSCTTTSLTAGSAYQLRTDASGSGFLVFDAEI